MRVVVVDPTSPNRVMWCFRRLTEAALATW